MIFDFCTFQGLVKRCYEPGPYSLEEVLSVFKFYFSCYEERFGQPHPNIRMEQIQKIIKKMPYLNEKEEQMLSAGGFPSVLASVYKHIIKRHFSTNYRGTDYNINHFFSGRIRELRYRDMKG